MKRATLLLAFFLIIVLWIGCLGLGKEGGKEGHESVLTASSGDQGGGEPRISPFVVNITLSEPPLINKTVTATIGVHNLDPRSIDNASIRLRLYRRVSLYNWGERKLVWEKVLWTGTIPGNGDAMTSGPLMIEEPGYFYASGWAFEIHPTFTPFSDVYLHLNVSENETIVTSGMGPLEPRPPPPPAIPYLVKMDLDGVPALNRPVNLRVTIASLMDVKNATFRIFLPEGFELVSGDLVWHGDLQKGIDESELSAPLDNIGKVPETNMKRIPEGKKVRMRVIIRATLRGDALIFVFPSQERPSTVNCDVQGLYKPHPLIGKEVDAGWQAISFGGCLNVRVFNETYGLSSEQALPPEPTPPKPPPPPETPPPGMMWQTQRR